ncbi:MAG TPA: PLD nuclease N-terminal domain-containing protein [Ktedonobacteraceae bacterium]|nr:PLD nuclease N-terminal domain-containing protein [Ktedonobacteraceae bacterium]
MEPQVGASIAVFLFVFLMVGLSIASVAFWIWMLVDCLTHEPEGSNKIAWILVILFANVVGSLIYYFVERVPRVRIPEQRGAHL